MRSELALVCLGALRQQHVFCQDVFQGQSVCARVCFLNPQGFSSAFQKCVETFFGRSIDASNSIEQTLAQSVDFIQYCRKDS